MTGTGGWNDYAPFYDWENARTLGRRDVAFWRAFARRQGASVLELGCGTGRLLTPIARAGVDITGIDRSEAMLARARTRARRLPREARPALVQGDIRALPFASASFGLVMAPYGMVQSLLSDRDLGAALRESARVLDRGGWLGVDLVPDLARWPAYRSRVRLRGRAGRGAIVTLVESVRQDRKRGLTTFDERFVERRGRIQQLHRFSLTFRTLPMAGMLKRIERAGFQIEAVLGDYKGRPWDPRADVWIVLARRASG
jgi:ubiquinone/menaquinone biosynthesis C-methylase UbiE